MKLSPIELTTRTGLRVLFRSPVPEDAHESVEYLRRIYAETDFLSGEPEEVNITDEQEKAYILRLQNDPLSLNVNVYVDGCLAGNASIQPVRNSLRMKHRVRLGIALFRPYWHEGIGELLISFLIDKARETGFELMELDVHARNERALRLYTRLGFAEQGRIHRAVRFKDGTYDDEIFMQKDLTK